MIARNIGHLCPMARHSEDQAEDFVMIGIPVPGSAKTPAINDIADEIEFLALNVTQEIYE
jgi:hypothetical protein